MSGNIKNSNNRLEGAGSDSRVGSGGGAEGLLQRHAHQRIGVWRLSLSGFVLRLSEHHGDGTPGSIVTVMGIGIEALHRELHDRNHKYMNPGLDVTEWGTRDVCVVAPFGNRIVFSERIDASAGDPQAPSA